MTETVQVATRKLVKKITMKTCGAQPNIEELIEFKKANGATAVMPLLDVIGIASDFKPGTSDLGPYVKLLGQFKAVNRDGEIFTSGAAILPGSGNDLVYGALKALEGQGGGSVSFKFRIGVRYVQDARGGVPYQYEIEQVYQPEVSDPLKALEVQLGGAPAALPAPAKPVEEKTHSAGGRRK